MILDENGQPMCVIYECWSDGEADVIVSCLGAHGIPARVNSEVPHNVLPLAVDGLGKVEVLVAEEDVEEAAFILRTRAGYLEDKNQDTTEPD
jgi:hypothetical protein